jgi:hypothetical protein
MSCSQSSLLERFVVCAWELSFRLPSGEIECEDSRWTVVFSREEFFSMPNSNPLRLRMNADCQEGPTLSAREVYGVIYNCPMPLQASRYDSSNRDPGISVASVGRLILEITPCTLWGSGNGTWWYRGL